MRVHFNPEIGDPPRRLWAFLASAALHVLVPVTLLVILGLLSLRLNEINSIADDKPIETVMLAPLPAPAQPRPLFERVPPPPESVIPEPPPSPPVPQPPSAPIVPPSAPIHPEDLIVEGARPEALPQPSRGNTPVPARPGSTEPPRLLPPTPLAPPTPIVPIAPRAVPEPLRLPLPQPSLRAAEGPSAPPEAPAPPQPVNPDPPRSGLPLPPQIAENSGGLTLPRLSNGRASSVVDTATQGISSQMAQRPAPASNVRTVTGSADRTGNSRGLEQQNFDTDEPQILSDTRGYDFGPYLNQVVTIVRRNWYSLIPESVRYNGQRGNVTLMFTIVKSGEVRDLVLQSTSGKEPLDRAAMGSITASNPFQSLPPGFTGDLLKLRFTFLYNVPRP